MLTSHPKLALAEGATESARAQINAIAVAPNADPDTVQALKDLCSATEYILHVLKDWEQKVNRQ
ncbi:hypothetical protein [Variovorax sp. RA8]|uniref:hypothetical protein n=1 Tax=Variovorax sp. (strain JCM 16519 / RA8) TaxID=662548 RepID=UPI000A6708A5|nr:hypothetical protein [Variovorax sp. RA8]VTU34204.1 hypothetical protein RA8CHR_04926 [Variovorax sp. RA8]